VNNFNNQKFSQMSSTKDLLNQIALLSGKYKNIYIKI